MIPDSVLRKLYAIGDPNWSYALGVLVIMVMAYSVGVTSGVVAINSGNQTLGDAEREVSELPEKIRENASNKQAPAVSDEMASSQLDTMLFFIMPAVRWGLSDAQQLGTQEAAARWITFIQTMMFMTVAVYAAGVVVRFRYK